MAETKINRIKEALKEKGRTQTWLAQELGKTFRIVNDYCSNKVQPPLEVLYKIAELLEVSPKDLLIDPQN